MFEFNSDLIAKSGAASDAMRGRIFLRNGGFTLVELITVMILLGILAAYAVARLDVSVYRERGFHDGLQSALQFARKAAVAKRRQVCVGVAGVGVAGSGEVSLSIVADTPENVAYSVAACPATSLNLPGSNANTLQTPSGVTLTAGSAFYFDALGRASADGTFSSSGPLTITVEQETGYVHVP